jgi:putative FmdB family regulatory protein
MPIYEYYCGKCGKEFEAMRPISKASEPALCPICGAEARKLVSACASKVDLYIRPSAKPAFRQHTAPARNKQKRSRKTRE